MNKLIRILHFGLTNNLGGTEVFVMNLYRKIDRTKVQFDFIDCEGIYFKDEIENLGGQIIVVPSRRENYIKNYRRLNEIINSGQYAAIHCHQLAIANIDPIKIALKQNSAKVILHSHSYMKLRHLRSEILHWYNKIWLQNKHIERFACSEQAGYWIHGKKQIENNNVYIFKNAIDINKFKYNKEISKQYKKDLHIEDKLVIGHVGRFAYGKNHDFLINVFNEIVKMKKNAVLVLIGGEGGLLEATKNKIKQLGLIDNVKFLGIREDVEKVMQAMDIFLFPSRWEGLGIVLIEAQASGLLTFTSDVVPIEAKVSNLLNYISLDASVETWAHNILTQYESHKRKDISLEIKAKGYDINETSRWLEEFYIGLSK